MAVHDSIAGSKEDDNKHNSSTQLKKKIRSAQSDLGSRGSGVRGANGLGGQKQSYRG